MKTFKDIKNTVWYSKPLAKALLVAIEPVLENRNLSGIQVFNYKNATHIVWRDYLIKISDNLHIEVFIDDLAHYCNLYNAYRILIANKIVPISTYDTVLQEYDQIPDQYKGWVSSSVENKALFVNWFKMSNVKTEKSWRQFERLNK